MGPRAELLTLGTLGEAGVALLYKTVGQVIRQRNLPPPAAEQTWTQDAVMGAAHEVFAGRNGVARLIALAGSSADEASFRAQLYKLVGNDLTSMGRRTERGKLSERIKTLRRDLPSVGLGYDGAAYSGAAGGGPRGLQAPVVRFDELVQAASAVPVIVPAWDPTSEHSAPIADRTSLLAMIKAVIGLAGTLEHGPLVNVLAARLGVHDAPIAADHETLDMLAPIAPGSPSAAAAASDAGWRLVAELSRAEQCVLPYLDEKFVDLVRLSGLGRTKAWETVADLRPKLQILLTGDEDPAGTLRVACALVIDRWGLT
jgi:hypothetical protein